MRWDDRSGQGAFHTTHWSVVLAAREPHLKTEAREALGTLCSTYWYPIYAFLRRDGCSPHEAEDLTQEFFYNFLERDSLRKVSPEGGKFRSYLLASLKNFLVNQRERANAKRRGGDCTIIPLEVDSAETKYSLEPVDKASPDVLFDRHWAWTLVDHALKRIEADYSRQSKDKLFQALRGFLPGAQQAPSREKAAADCGITLGALDVAIHRLRQRFGAALREGVAETVESVAEVEPEIRYHITILGG